MSSYGSGEKAPALQIKQLVVEIDSLAGVTEEFDEPHNLNLPPMVKVYFQVNGGPIFRTPVAFHIDTGTEIYELMRGVEPYVYSKFSPSDPDPTFDELTVIVFNNSIDLDSTVKMWIFVYDVLAGSSNE